MANYVRKTFTWHWRSVLRLPRPLLEDFTLLCTCFSLSKAEAAAVESVLPEIVEVTFCAMLLNEILSSELFTSTQLKE